MKNLDNKMINKPRYNKYETKIEHSSQRSLSVYFESRHCKVKLLDKALKDCFCYPKLDSGSLLSTYLKNNTLATAFGIVLLRTLSLLYV